MCAEYRNQLFEIARKGSFERNLGFAYRMLEFEAVGVEGLTGKTATGSLRLGLENIAPLPAGVEWITDDGVTDVGHVNADLVGSAADGTAADP